MREPVFTSIDGVPVVWADIPGPMRAALHFRAGVAYETPPSHGISHLVEHLALHGLHDRTYGYNGATDLNRVTFYAGGEPDEVAEFVGHVCARLTDLPADRVEVERQVLRAEADSRPGSYRDRLLHWRYGAQGFGLPGMDEYGLRWLDADAVRAWSAERFTRQNAVLVLTGPPPAGLRLPLPDGPAHPPVVAVPIEQPGWFASSAAGIGVGGLVPRAFAAPLAVRALAEELNRVLRFERGLTYSVSGGYEPLDAQTAHVTFAADGDPERHAELRDGFLEVLDRLTADGVDPAKVDVLKAQWAKGEEDARLVGAFDSIAFDFLVGRPVQPVAELVNGFRGVGPDDVTAAVRAFASSAFFLLPSPLDLPAPRYRRLPLSSSWTVRGRTFPARAGAEWLVVGDEGISVVDGDTVVTVRWRDTTAALWWQDGARVVIGRDGFGVTVVPADWQGGDEVVALIDQRAPRAAAVPMGATGPRPATVQQPPEPQPRLRPALRWTLVVIAYLIAAMMLALALAGPQPPQGTQEAVTADDIATFAFIGVAMGVAATWQAVHLVRHRRAPRAA